ncbi:small multidrug efflux protein [Kocuria sp. M1N1S27]|uniref:small multidrug efflux protein n=1 Tax=Kocuria kalidii TaxID=3376283 RepID=UPI0037B83E9E
MNNPYEGLQNFIEQVPDILQPLIVAVAAAIPYIEGEGAAALGIIAGINPVVAAIAGAAGNILGVVGVVFLGSRIRERGLARRAATRGATQVDGLAAVAPLQEASAGTVSRSAASGTASIRSLEQPATDDDVRGPNARPTRREKGRARLGRWMVRFGVPGASILAPLALPTMLTAAFFVASGVPKQWVILWQAIAIVLWTGAVALAARGVLALLGW